MVLGHFGPKKPTHTYPNKTTAYPYSYPNPTTTSLPNSTLEAQFGVSMSRFGFERKSKSRNLFFFFFLPVRHSLVDLPSTNSLTPSRKMIIGSAFFHSLSACAPGHCLIRNFHRLSIFCFAVIWNIAFLRGKN